MIRLYVLAMVFFTANSVLTVIFPLQATSYGYKEGQIGIMMGLYMFVCMFLRPWAGQMVAKYSVFTVMKWLLLGHTSALLLYVWLGVDSLYVVRAMQGVVTAFFSMAMQMGIGTILEDQDRGQGMSMYSLSTVLPGLYGPALALLLWTHAAPAVTGLLIAALAVLPLLCAVGTPLPKERQENLSFTLRDIPAALKQVRGHNGLIVSFYVLVIGSCVFGAISTFLPLYMVTTGQGNAALYLFLQAGVVVGSRFWLRKVIPSDGRWHPKFMSLVLVSSLVGTGILAFLPQLGHWVYISALFNGLASAMLYPTISTYFSFAIPKEVKPVLFGIFLTAYDLGFSAGGFLMGYVIQLSSYTMMFAGCSVIALVAIILILIQHRMEVRGISIHDQAPLANR